jgi:hypothetical protein
VGWWWSVTREEALAVVWDCYNAAVEAVYDAWEAEIERINKEYPE